MARKTTVIFDFDRTLIEDDSDRWVISKMGLTPFYNQLRPTLPWTSLMDRMVEEVHAKGNTVDDVVECLESVPLHPRIVAAIQSAFALGCDLKIVSDANAFYIETVLKHHGVYDCFSEIISNPASVNEEGRLRILPYHDLALPHGCDLCPPNMCKGLIIKRIQDSISEDDKRGFIYIGDGHGDYCPILKLGKGDHVMPRKDYPLWQIILRNPSIVEAEVHEWSNGEELEQCLLQLIHITSGENINPDDSSE